MKRKKHGRRGLMLALLKVRRGDCAALERDAREDVDRLAQFVWRTIDAPPSVDFEDCRQEVLVALWKATMKWDPKRGVRLVTHAMWNAITSSRKWLHEQREALGKRDSKKPSRYALNFSRFEREGAEGEFALPSFLTPMDGGRAAEIAEAISHYRSLLAQLDPVESALVKILVDEQGDVHAAARTAMAAKEVSSVLEFRTEDEAVQCIIAVAERLQSAA